MAGGQGSTLGSGSIPDAPRCEKKYNQLNSGNTPPFERRLSCDGCFSFLLFSDMMKENDGGLLMFVQEYSDDVRIIASGSFILKGNKSNAQLHINLMPEYNFSMNVTFTFKAERIEGDTTVKAGKIDENGIELMIYNAENLLGNGTQKPSPIAEFTDGKKLFIHYFFNRPDPENPRIFTYSIFMEG